METRVSMGRGNSGRRPSARAQQRQARGLLVVAGLLCLALVLVATVTGVLAVSKVVHSVTELAGARQKALEEESAWEVPNHLKDASRDSEGFKHGEGYLYPHAYRDHWVSQQYLPTGLKGKVFYIPSDQGYEAGIRKSVLEKREAQLESVVEDQWQEELTHSPNDKERVHWIERAIGNKTGVLRDLTDKLFEDLDLRRYENTLTLSASRGLLLWPLKRLTPEGLAVAFVRKEEEKKVIEHFATEFEEIEKPLVVV